jgi:NADH-quinone oxidoreductase subunit D
MEALIHHFKLVSEGVSVPKGETYVPVEGPRGEVGFYIISDGSNVPSRVKLRAPSFMAIPGMCAMMEGCFIADVVGIIGSIDIVMGEVDR